MKPRRFLFLQGPCSPFFARLGQALRSAGHDVRKVHFSVGDRLYWRLGQAVNYRGPMAQLAAFYAGQYAAHGITDVVLFGDCRPVHRPAIAQARQHGIRVHVLEEGYFRPYWITLEQGGVNAHSTLPKEANWYRRQARAAQVPDYGNGTPFASPFWQRAVYDVAYHLASLLNPLLHAGVISHMPEHPFKEYLGYLRRGALHYPRSRAAHATQNRLIAACATHPFYLLPLQLNNDAQITHHSPFASMEQAMLHVLASFARAAPAHTRLAVKLHPLDPGLVNYRKQLRAAAHHLGVAARVFFLDSGKLPALLSATAGVVTVNSTVGCSALVHQRPAIALGQCIYALEGLTFQGSLDAFWSDGAKPDGKLFRCFRNVVIARTQVNGGLYSGAGIRLAVQNAQQRLLGSDA